MRWIATLLALSLALIYIAFSPSTIADMGYTGEEMRAGNEILGFLPATPFHMSRNGILPLTLDAPFLAAGAAVMKDRERGQDLILAIAPGLYTALTLALLFYWGYRISDNPKYSLAVTLAAGFCTILWPYAYIGLETKQSLFLLIAAFIALEHRRPGSWWAAAGFSLALAYALGLKSTGAFLIPVASYLAWEYARRVRRDEVKRPRVWKIIALATMVPTAVFALNGYSRSFHWDQVGGTAYFIEYWRVRDFLYPILNFAAFFGSPNKGLWVFAPVCLLACWAVPQAIRLQPRLAAFALLTLLGLAGGFSLLRDWSDETWGPRYLHSAIAPLMLVLVAAFPRPSRTLRMSLLALALPGFCAALLGVMFHYGKLIWATTRIDQNTLEAFQGDIALNHLRFNARLLYSWQHPAEAAPFTSARQWFFELPAGAPPPKSIDLREYAIPQPILIRHLSTPKPGIIGRLWGGYLACLMAGLALLGLVTSRIGRTRAVPP